MIRRLKKDDLSVFGHILPSNVVETMKEMKIGRSSLESEHADSDSAVPNK